MISAPISEQTPIRVDNGRLRVGQTRVLLDLVIYAFRLGSTPENITDTMACGGQPCQVLKVSRSGYYAWRQRPMSAREASNRALVREIQRVHQASRQTYAARAFMPS